MPSIFHRVKLRRQHDPGSKEALLSAQLASLSPPPTPPSTLSSSTSTIGPSILLSQTKDSNAPSNLLSQLNDTNAPSVAPSHTPTVKLPLSLETGPIETTSTSKSGKKIRFYPDAAVNETSAKGKLE